MTVEQHRNGQSPDPVDQKAGRHRLQRGTPMPGFDRVGATPDQYVAASILERHGREVAPVTRRAR